MSYNYTTTQIANLHEFQLYLIKNAFQPLTLDYDTIEHNLTLSFAVSLDDVQEPSLEALVAAFKPSITDSVSIPVFNTTTNFGVYSNFAIFQWLPEINSTPYSFNVFAYGTGTFQVRIYNLTDNSVVVESDTLNNVNIEPISMQLLNISTMPDTQCVLECQAKVLSFNSTCSIQGCYIDFV